MRNSKKEQRQNGLLSGNRGRSKILWPAAAIAVVLTVLGWVSAKGSRAIVYVDVNSGTDQVGCGITPGTGACRTIRYTLDNETGAGDTVSLAPGTYNENIVIDKRIVLQGSGSGSNPAADTIIASSAPSTNVIRLNRGGVSANERLIIRNLRVTGGSGGPNPGNGINIVTGSFVTFDNVASVGNDGNGIAFDPGGDQTDYIIANCNLSNNPGGSGFRVPTTASVDGLVITGSTMDGNYAIGLSMYGPVTGLYAGDSSFDNNGIVGIYGKVNDFVIKKGVVIDNVTANGSGRGIALRIYGGSVTISDSTISDNNRINPDDTGQGLDLSVREEGCEITLSNVTAQNNEDVNIFIETKYGGSLTKATIRNVVVSGSNGEPTAVFCDGCGIWLHTLGTGALGNVSITKSTISGNNRGIVLEAETQPLNNISIMDNRILDNSTTAGIAISDNAAAGNRAHNNTISGNGTGVENQDPDDIFDAGDNWWGNSSGPYHGVTNPSGTGDEVSDNVTYAPWLPTMPWGPDITANGSDGPLTISRAETLSIVITLIAGDHWRSDADWWCIVNTPRPTPHDWYYYHTRDGWLPGNEVSYQGPLKDIAAMEVMNMSGLKTGVYIFYFGVDLIMNGVPDITQATTDKVRVIVTD
jgi:hypothetical protein